MHYYRIIDFLTVFSNIAEMLICRKCKRDVKFKECGNRGLGFQLVIACRCGSRKIHLGPLINTGYEINRRIVFVMRLLGVGRESINSFCGLMDIAQGMSISAYDKIVDHIHSVANTVFDVLCQKAVNEEKEQNIKNERPATTLKVSGDESWKKRGFTSLYGVTTLIGYYSGKLLDLVVKGSYYQSCTFWKNKQDTEQYIEWFEGHKEECIANHVVLLVRWK
ncbi:hypothetical protein X777_07984 [Ooceraea biroi]|uniref:Mutator-like transposase domain-containing protein n=1 Tax=Ooceraea biroi TaxID=2015173 RepID=A0A026W9Z1_OOCBI|nr:hypothetical protein X777_07984 [Ooceraea biroi]